MAKWSAFPHAGEYPFDAASVQRHWARLHAGDAEPCPREPAVLEAWALYHSGEFQQAAEAGLRAGAAGITVANKATSIYANYLEKKERTRLDLFMEVAQRAEAQAAADSAKKFVKYSVIAGVVVAVIYGILIAVGAMNTDVNTAMVAFDLLNLG